MCKWSHLSAHVVLPYADSEDSISESKETKQQETC